MMRPNCLIEYDAATRVAKDAGIPHRTAFFLVFRLASLMESFHQLMDEVSVLEAGVEQAKGRKRRQK